MPPAVKVPSEPENDCATKAISTGICAIEFTQTLMLNTSLMTGIVVTNATVARKALAVSASHGFDFDLVQKLLA